MASCSLNDMKVVLWYNFMGDSNIDQQLEVITLALGYDYSHNTTLFQVVRKNLKEEMEFEMAKNSYEGKLN